MLEDPEDSFVQKRLLLAVLISMVAVGAYFYVATQYGPPVQPPPAVEETAEDAPAEGATESAPQVAAAAAGDAGDESAAEGEESEEPAAPTEVVGTPQVIVVESETITIHIDTNGGVLRHWYLKDYRDSEEQPLDLVHQAGGEKFGFPLSFFAPDGKPMEELSGAVFAVNEGGTKRTAPATVRLEYDRGGVRAVKELQVPAEGYVVDLHTELETGGNPRPHLIGWTGGFGDTAQTRDSYYSQTFIYDTAAGSVEFFDSGDGDNGEPLVLEGPYDFAGIGDLFFAAVWLPPNAETIRLWMNEIEIVPAEGESEQEFPGVALGGRANQSYQLFVGPRQMETLAAVHPRMHDLVDFGFIGIVSEPLFHTLRWVHANVVQNWGWAIVVLTFAINMLLFPLKWTSTRSMKKLQQLQPLVNEINERYKGMGMRDPRKQKQSEEMMDLYKKYGASPLGSCWPMVLQMPILYAFYAMILTAIELRHAEWLWVLDLSAPENLAIRVLPISMVALQFVQQSITPQPATMDPAQMRIMKFMPLMFGFFFYSLPSGLVLYWLATNVVGIVQQFILNRLPVPQLDIPQPKAAPPKRAKKKRK